MFSTTYTFGYNGVGDRLSQTVGITTTRYVLDPAAGLTQVLADGTNTYLYGNGRLAQYQAVMQYFGADGLGSVRQLYDANAQVIANNRYDPYGNVLSQYGSATSVFGFTGEQYDATGLVFLRARYYSVAQGRFVTRDVWEGDPNAPMSYNAWSYTNGNPVNFTDPSGHDIYTCDYSKNPPKCRRIHIYRGPTFSYTELLALYLDVYPRGGTYDALPDYTWIEQHVHEWNGDWGTDDYGYPYEPSMAETLMWSMAEDRYCGISNTRNAALVAALSDLPFVTGDVLSELPAYLKSRQATSKPSGTKATTYTSDTLTKNMEAKGIQKPPDTAAHHIVAENDARAEPARRILRRAGIPISDSDNGVFLPANKTVADPPAATHSTLNTKVYHDEVNRRLSNAAPGTVRDVLRQIATELEAGTFPH